MFKDLMRRTYHEMHETNPISMHHIRKPNQIATDGDESSPTTMPFGTAVPIAKCLNNYHNLCIGSDPGNTRYVAVASAIHNNSIVAVTLLP